MDVSVIILNYNSFDLTNQTISTFSKFAEGFSYEIIVIDNNSQDDSFDKLKHIYPDIIFIKNDENLGFGNMFIGFAWALASIAEITVMINSTRLFARFPLENVLVFSFFAACVRWILLFFAVSPAAILLSKIMIPETQETLTGDKIEWDSMKPDESNIVEAAANGASSDSRRRGGCR